MNKPQINITPLIDVLLVLLVIFMVIAPAKPTSFHARVPTPSDSRVHDVNIDNLVVTVRADESLEINSSDGFGDVENPDRLVEKLREVFLERTRDGRFRSDSNEIEKTVFLRAPSRLSYGSVAKVVDALKMSGADPIALQIDGLPRDR
jgi:biopolymer transport protein ExbD